MTVWKCIGCHEKQNEDGRCANIASDLCPECYHSKDVVPSLLFWWSVYN